MASSKARVTRCDLSDRLFCIRARCFCEFKAMRYESTSFNRIVANKWYLLKPGLHNAICLTDYFVFALGDSVNFKAMRYESTSFNRIVANKSHLLRPGLTQCDLSDR